MAHSQVHPYRVTGGGRAATESKGSKANKGSKRRGSDGGGAGRGFSIGRVTRRMGVLLRGGGRAGIRPKVRRTLAYLGALMLGAALAKVSVLDVPAALAIGLSLALLCARRPGWALFALVGGLLGGAPGLPAEPWVLITGWVAAAAAVRWWNRRAANPNGGRAAGLTVVVATTAFLSGSAAAAAPGGSTLLRMSEILIGAVLAGLYAQWLLPLLTRLVNGRAETGGAGVGADGAETGGAGGVGAAGAGTAVVGAARAPYTPREKAGLLVAGTSLLLAANGVQAGSVDLLGVAAGWAILVAAQLAGPRGGAVTGLFVGLVMGLFITLPPEGSPATWVIALGSGVDTGAMFAMMAAGRLGVCGMVSGLVRRTGRRLSRLTTCVGFGSGIALLSLGVSDMEAWTILWSSGAVAVLVFLMTPAPWMQALPLGALLGLPAAGGRWREGGIGRVPGTGGLQGQGGRAAPETWWMGPGGGGGQAVAGMQPEDADEWATAPAEEWYGGGAEGGLPARQSALRHRIEEVSGVFRQMSDAFREDTEERVQESREMNTFVQGVYQEVCAGCRMRDACWNGAFFQTYWDLVGYAAAQARVRGGAPEAESDAHTKPSRHQTAGLHMLGGLRERCIQPVRLVEAAEGSLGRLEEDQAWYRRMSTAHRLVGVQLDGVAEMMERFARDGIPEVRPLPVVEERVRRVLGGAAETVMDVSVLEACGGRAAVRVKVAVPLPDDQPDQVDAVPVVLALCDTLSRIFGIPYILWRSDRYPDRSQGLGGGGEDVDERTVGGNEKDVDLEGHIPFRFLFVPEPPYDFRVSALNQTPQGVEESGDTTVTIHLPDGRMALVLSDGMGTGPRAALESRTTARLLESMLRAGLDWRFSVQMINTILVLRSPQERFSTVDLGLLDLYEGTCEFVKIGAAPSFVKRAGGGGGRSSRRSVEMVSAESLPLGILSQVDAEVRPAKLEVGDLLVWVSDGVLDARKEATDKEAWLMRVLRTLDTFDPALVSARVMAASSARGGKEAADDRSVVAALLVRRHTRKVGKSPIDRVDRLEPGAPGESGASGDGIPSYRTG